MVSIKSKKGQAALEFLTTYGWALMMMGVVFGSFGYLLSTDAFVADTCYVNGDFSCDAYNLKSEQLNIRLKNLAGETLSLNNGVDLGIECNYEDGGISGFAAGPAVVNVGENIDLTCNLTGMPTNQKQKVTFTVFYTKASKSFKSTAEGYVVTNHEP